MKFNLIKCIHIAVERGKKDKYYAFDQTMPDDDEKGKYYRNNPVVQQVKHDSF